MVASDDAQTHVGKVKDVDFEQLVHAAAAADVEILLVVAVGDLVKAHWHRADNHLPAEFAQFVVKLCARKNNKKSQKKMQASSTTTTTMTRLAHRRHVDDNGEKVEIKVLRAELVERKLEHADAAAT